MPLHDKHHAGRVSLEQLAAETFEPHVGDTFSSDALGPLELIDVASWDDPPGPGGRAPFSLVFRAEPGRSASQGIAELVHRDIGAMQIFLVPLGPDADGRMRYEAVFS